MFSCEQLRQASDEAAQEATRASNDYATKYEEYERVYSSSHATLVLAGIVSPGTINPRMLLAAMQSSALSDTPVALAARIAVDAEDAANLARDRSQQAIQAYQECLAKGQKNL